MASPTPLYPWTKWFNLRGTMKRITLKHGKDFFCQPHGMASLIRNKASKQGLAAAIHIAGNILSVTLRKA